MVNPTLISIIKDELKNNISGNEIMTRLMSKGWNKQDIQDSFSFVDTSASTVAQSPESDDSSASVSVAQSAKKHHPVITSIIIVGGIIGSLLVGAFLIWLFAPQVFISPFVHAILPKSRTPQAYSIPVNRTVSSPIINKADYPHVIYLGISFTTPWEITKKIPEQNALLLQFDQNRSLVLFHSTTKMVTEFKKGKPEDIQKIENVFGNNALDSDYNLYSTIINSSPDQITFSTPPQQAFGKFTLVVLKNAIVTATGATDQQAYRFSTNNIQGYQFSSSVNHKIFIHFFTKQDDSYDLEFIGDSITQNDIDFILSSIMPTSAADPNLPIISNSPNQTNSEDTQLVPTIAQSAPQTSQTSNFQSKGAVTVEQNMTVTVSKVWEDANYVYMTADIKNTGGTTASLSHTFEMSSNNTYTPAHIYPAVSGINSDSILVGMSPVSPGQTLEVSMSFAKNGLHGPYTFNTFSSNNVNNILGTLSQ